MKLDEQIAYVHQEIEYHEALLRTAAPWDDTDDIERKLGVMRRALGKLETDAGIRQERWQSAADVVRRCACEEP